MTTTNPKKKIGMIFAFLILFAIVSYCFLDQKLAFFIADHVPDDARNYADALSFLVEPLVIPLYLLVLLKIYESESKTVKGLIAFGAATVTIEALIPILKFVLSRPRPSFFLTHGTSHIMPLNFGTNFVSMPSGHAAACGILTVLCLYLFKGHLRKLAIIPILFSLLRILSLKHFLSDVIVGYALGFTITMFFVISQRTFIDNLKALIWKNGKIV